jgi:hypothetical protein
VPIYRVVGSYARPEPLVGRVDSARSLGEAAAGDLHGRRQAHECDDRKKRLKSESAAIDANDQQRSPENIAAVSNALARQRTTAQTIRRSISPRAESSLDGVVMGISPRPGSDWRPAGPIVTHVNSREQASRPYPGMTNVPRSALPPTCVTSDDPPSAASAHALLACLLRAT